MSRSRHITRGTTVAAVALTTLILLAALASVAAAVPGTVTGITSSTHPGETTWYSNNSPSFAWEPALSDGTAISGYSCLLDRSLTTVPDTVSDRNSLTYLPRVAYAVGGRPAEARIVDVSGDGKPDLVVENYNSNTLSVLLGNGDGTLKAKVDYATAEGPWSMAIGDVNGDGKTDVVTDNYLASSASVLISNGDGTFRAKADYTTGAGTNPECLRMGDVDGDGDLDIFTANASTNNVSILLNDGNGGFSAPSTFSTATHPTSIDLSDLNADGKQDLSTANYSAGSVSVLMGNGNGTFHAAVNYAASGNPQMVLAVDLNGDGKPDLSTVNWGTNNASILLNNGDGTFKTAVSYAIGNGPYAFSVIDLNQDSAPDLVTTNNSDSSVSVLYGNGDGTFDPKRDLSTGSGPCFVALGDLNGDGYGDMITTDMNDNTVSVFRGTAFLGASYTGKADGVWYFHVRAVNAAGVGGPTTTRELRIDVTTPATSDRSAPALAANGDSAWRQTGQTVTLEAADVSSGLAHTYYTLDGVQHDYDGSFHVSGAGSHPITYWSTDVAGNIEAAHHGWVNIDGDAPSSSDASIPALASDSLSGWHNAAQSVTLSAADTGAGAVSGVAWIEYDLDGAGYVPYAAPFLVAAQGSHTLSYRAVDRAGNVEAAHAAFVNIDLSAPAISSSADGDTAWHDADVDVTLTSADTGGSGLAAVRMRRAGASEWTDVTGGFTAPAAGENGPVSYEYRAMDGAGNETAGSCTLRFDTTAPETHDDYAGGSAWQTGPVSFTLTPDDATSGVAGTSWAVDEEAPQSGTAVTVTGDGTHTVSYFSTDAAGNAEPAHSVTVRIDATAPATHDDYAGGSAWQTGPVSFTLTPDDATSGFAGTSWTVDEDAPQSGTAVTVTGDGVHTVSYFSTDAAGNAEPAHSVTVRIDATAPATHDDYAGGSAWQTGDVHFTLTPDDATSGVAGTSWAVDEEAPQSGTAVTVTGDGVHTVSYFSTDAAGNAEPAHSVTVRIDATAPATHDDYAGGSAWQTGDVHFTLTPDDATSGVAGTSWAVDEEAPQSGTAVTVTGDGTHTVTYTSTDAAGNQETPHSVTVRIDATLPQTTDASDPALAADRDSTWRRTGQMVSLLAADAGGSGLAATYYTLDGTQHDYTGPFAVIGDGSHEITWWSADAAGNTEAVHTGYVNIWGSAPHTSASAVVSAAGEGWRTSGPQPVSLTATGGRGDVTVHYLLDGVVQADAAGKATFDVPGDGSHELEYWATDELGNEETHHTGCVNIDTVKPATSDDYAGGSAWQTGPVSFTLTATDATSGVAGTTWTVDGATHSGTDVLVTGDGEHVVTYASTDEAGNAEAVRSVTVRIDAGAPATADDAPAGWQTADTTVTLTPKDTLSGMSGGDAATTWELDGGATQTGRSVLVGAPSDHSGDGARTITYRSTDAAGNGEHDQTATVLVDTLAPTTRDDLASGPPAHTDPVTVTLHASDEHGSLDVSGVAVTHYRVDKGLWQTGTSVEVTGDGEHTVSYYSTDNAGNDEAAKTSTTVTIATTPPGASSDDAPAGWVNHAVTVTLTPGARALRTTWELDGGATQTGTSVTVAALADHTGDGTHALTYRSWAFGDVAEPTRTAAVRVDTRAPETSDNAPAGWQGGAVTVTLSPSADVSGVAGTTWSLDSGAAHAGTSVPVSGDGVHTLTYFSTDNAGNAEAVHTATVRIDGAAPLASCAEAGRWFKTASLTATIVASDAVSGVAKVEYRLGQGDWQQGASVPVSGAGAHAISYRVTDTCGNVATGGCVVGIDTARPKTVKALASKGKKKSGKLTLAFSVKDPKPSCGAATVTRIVVTNAKGRKVATIKRLTTVVKTNAKVKLVVKKKLKKGTYRFKVYVTDIAGNTSKKATPGKLVVK